MKSLGRQFSCILLLPFLISLIGSQQLIFELKDRQYQEVIFSGDVTVAMICEITDVTQAEVTISVDGVLVATNNGEGNCLEFVISRIDSTDNVNLTCSARYNKDVDMTTVTDTKTLILNVSGIDHSCFRNGTGINQPYHVGDVLLLSCYCRATEPCIWTETVVGTDIGSVIKPIEETTYNNKKIRRIVVGPFNNTHINTLRYDCSHGPTVDLRCSIGPVGDSAGDFILNPTDPSEKSLKCSVIEVFGRGDESSSTVIPFGTPSVTVSGGNNNSNTSVDKERGTVVEEEDDDSFFILIIVVVGILLLLIVLIISLLFLIKRTRKNKESKAHEEKQQTGRQTKDSENQNANSFDGEGGAATGQSDLFQNGHITGNGVSAANIAHQTFDNHGYVGTVTDDYSALFQQGQVSDYGICAAYLADNSDAEKYYGTQASVPVLNDRYTHDDEDQFQTAETSDYVLPVAMMKMSMQRELTEAVGLYAQVKKYNTQQ
ncbi:hypothetical protein HOLleu_27002 [Holothuria leucospilota]|uniref:Uncharacterized protein n=1 Tax=Holothuria leucospilota TaxID=206669 RepID=A0A9Q1BPZ3_HOLLE|nr:hypothetical protein HOLleu_27002 [Holothuria leucospilota]